MRNLIPCIDRFPSLALHRMNTLSSLLSIGRYSSLTSCVYEAWVAAFMNPSQHSVTRGHSLSEQFDGVETLRALNCSRNTLPLPSIRFCYPTDHWTLSWASLIQSRPIHNISVSSVVILFSPLRPWLSDSLSSTFCFKLYTRQIP